MPQSMHNVNIHVKHDYARGGLDLAPPLTHTVRMNIEHLRRLRDLNQTELAEMTQLSQSAISRAEAGEDSVTLRNFRKISAALKVPLADLFEDDRSKSENELLGLYRQLPAERQALWLQVSRTFVEDRSVSNAETRRNRNQT